MNLDRWNAFTLHQKLGNIGSEVARARLWEEKKDIQSRNLALGRTLEMIDATLSSTLPVSGKKELLKAKEVLGSWFSNDQEINYSPRLLEEYFTHFAYLAS